MITFKEALRTNLLGMQKFAENLLVPGIVCKGLFEGTYYIVVNPNKIDQDGNSFADVLKLFYYNKKYRSLVVYYNKIFTEPKTLKPLRPRRILTEQEMNEVWHNRKVIDKLKGLKIRDKEGNFYTL